MTEGNGVGAALGRAELVTNPLGYVASRVVLSIVAAGRGLRTMAASVRLSFFATYPDYGAETSDAVDGSEFLDDRLRLRE